VRDENFVAPQEWKIPSIDSILACDGNEFHYSSIVLSALSRLYI